MPPSLRLLWLALWPAVSQAARRRVRFGMIPFSMPPWSERDPQTGEYEGGFFVDFFREVGYEAGFDVEFVAITNPHYLDDFRGVTCKALDAGQIDLGWDPNTTADPGYLHTQPIVSFTNVVLTKRTHSPVSLWNIFLPFRFELWMTIAACILYGAVVLVLLKAIHEGDSSVWDCLRMCPSRLYYSAAAMLGGDDYDEYHNLPLGRLYRLGLLFLVLVSGATYTANLAAFLTKPNFEVHGPKTMEDLKHATVCTRYPTYASRIRRFVREVVEPPLNMSFPDRQPWAQEKLQNGECEAIVEVTPNAKMESLEFCETMHLNRDISFMQTFDLFKLRRNETKLWLSTSKAIETIMARPSYTQMLHRNMRFGTSCSDTGFGQSDMQKITIKEMGAVFIVFFACGLLAIALSMVLRFCKSGPEHDEEARQVEAVLTFEQLPGEEPNTELQNSLLLSRKLDRVLEELRLLRHASSRSGHDGSVAILSP